MNVLFIGGLMSFFRVVIVIFMFMYVFMLCGFLGYREKVVEVLEMMVFEMKLRVIV